MIIEEEDEEDVSSGSNSNNDGSHNSSFTTTNTSSRYLGQDDPNLSRSFGNLRLRRRNSTNVSPLTGSGSSPYINTSSSAVVPPLLNSPRTSASRKHILHNALDNDSFFQHQDTITGIGAPIQEPQDTSIQLFTFSNVTQLGHKL
ncbi:hypothetical protein SAMD00019534_043530 [Acytostelium subglobosum LB1]|uniref:hypothetical protein n=1 Tax=Acytostelium subglobosum LB1 TaxID=1410327 RepID=UPI000644927F|nr:hypothetical protein SAMD00019534_043530 [Acytostelium subglobosum LB1]GAM21178.1 hypothetical protein SAMD00019534_043530 [Acytostelium subglobosum LB1]|eukprot:XP_012756312.1 hypothetical protein SAMD00019534_043530 [Acytostelium subglobosum LB1]